MKQDFLKTKVFALGLGVLVSLAASEAMAECRGGTVVKGANNHEYCVSDITMTWWAAFTWCQANKRTLATWEQACPGSARGGDCTNFRQSTDPAKTGLSVGSWTASPTASNTSHYGKTGLVIRPSNGDTLSGETGKMRSDIFNAICY